MSDERKPHADEMIFVPQVKADNVSPEAPVPANAVSSQRSLHPWSVSAGLTDLFPLAGSIMGALRKQIEEQARSSGRTGRDADDEVAAVGFSVTDEWAEQALWQHYMELTLDNPALHDALFAIEDTLPNHRL